jgi:hypothetical protein
LFDAALRELKMQQGKMSTWFSTKDQAGWSPQVPYRQRLVFVSIDKTKRLNESRKA